jgi:hypothetical protein
MAEYAGPSRSSGRACEPVSRKTDRIWRTGTRYPAGLPGLPSMTMLQRAVMTRAMNRCLATGVMLCCAAATNAQRRPVVVKLFTSQACSSCPPADAYVATLSTRPDIIALSFHVGYWDDLGWRDRFALPAPVERQNNYARKQHHSSVYTPQLIVDGREDGFRSDGKMVARALSQNRDGVPVGVSVHDAEIQVDIGAQPGRAPSDVVLVAFLRHAVSNVGRGENAGRTLEEFDIVRGVRALGPWKGETLNFRLPIASLPSDATDVAILVQPLGQAAIIGAGVRALR